jgi:cyclopropane fatty-acyl-phospholipid synthase-like methyltransferase
LTDQPRRIVRDGYDRLGAGYSEWAARVEKDPRGEMLSKFAGLLPSGARVLDLGCGSGLPSTAALASQYEVTGVDISEAQVRAARRNVPGTTVIHGDALQVSFAEGSFEGVVALYAVSHIPRAEHAQLFQRVYRWLVPGGLFLATLGATDAPDWTGDWLGVPMFFSAHDATTNRSLLREAGFDLLLDEIRQTDEPDGAVSFLWVIARRPL